VIYHGISWSLIIFPMLWWPPMGLSRNLACISPRVPSRRIQFVVKTKVFLLADSASQHLLCAN
jgi:hypothetical protein